MNKDNSISPSAAPEFRGTHQTDTGTAFDIAAEFERCQRIEAQLDAPRPRHEEPDIVALRCAGAEVEARLNADIKDQVGLIKWMQSSGTKQDRINEATRLLNDLVEFSKYVNRITKAFLEQEKKITSLTAEANQRTKQYWDIKRELHRAKSITIQNGTL